MGDLLLVQSEGIPLKDEEKRLVESHVDDCISCRFEKDLYRTLAYGSGLDSPVEQSDSAHREAVVRSAVDGYLKEKHTGVEGAARKALHFRWALATVSAAALVILSAAAYFSIFKGVLEEEETYRSELVSTAASGEVSAGGKAVSAGSILEEGSRIRVGHGFFSFSDGKIFTIHVRKHSVLTIGAVKDGKRSLTLEAGYIVAEVAGEAGKPCLEIRVGDALLYDRGTIFAVEKSGGGMFVRVIEGVVLVREKTGEEFTVEKGKKLLLGYPRGGLADLTEDERKEILRIIGRVLPAGELKRTVDVQEEERGSGRAEPVPATGVPDAKAGPSEKPAVPKKKVGDALGVKKPGPSDLLKIARQKRNQKDWNGAISTYHELLNNFTSSGEAEISAISLAEIYLEHKGNPGKALKYYKKYRTENPGGPLVKQASYGIIQCYRKMGNVEKEVEEIDNFINKFPGDIYTNKFKERLEDIQEQ